MQDWLAQARTTRTLQRQDSVQRQKVRLPPPQTLLWGSERKGIHSAFTPGSQASLLRIQILFYTSLSLSGVLEPLEYSQKVPSLLPSAGPPGNWHKTIQHNYKLRSTVGSRYGVGQSKSQTLLPSMAGFHQSLASSVSQSKLLQHFSCTVQLKVLHKSARNTNACFLIDHSEMFHIVTLK